MFRKMRKFFDTVAPVFAVGLLAYVMWLPMGKPMLIDMFWWLRWI